MTQFLDSMDRKRKIEFEHSYREGWVVMKIYNDKSTYGDCIDIPEDAFREIMENGKACLKASNGQ